MNFLKNLFGGLTTSILSSPQGIFLLIALGLFLAILVPNYNQIKEKLGFDTVSSLRVEKTELKQEVKEAKQAVAESVSEAALREKLCGLNTDGVKELKDKKAKNSDSFEEIKRKIKPIMHKVVAAKTSTVQPVESSTETSPEPIDLIWAAYKATAT